MNDRRVLPALVSTAVLLALWTLVSAAVGSTFILPPPWSVARDLWNLTASTSFYPQMVATFGRGILAFLLSAFLSALLGCASGVSVRADSALRPWLSMIKSTPVVSIILIALLWFGSSFVPVFVSILMTLPVMTESLSRGIRETDPKLLEMAKIYRFSRRVTLTRIQIPAAIPFFLAGAGSALGLTWKVVVAGEILGLPRTGIGTAIQTARVQLESARVLSLTVMAILLSVVSERLFILIAKGFKASTQEGPVDH